MDVQLLGQSQHHRTRNELTQQLREEFGRSHLLDLTTNAVGDLLGREGGFQVENKFHLAFVDQCIDRITAQTQHCRAFDTSIRERHLTKLLAGKFVIDQHLHIDIAQRQPLQFVQMGVGRFERNERRTHRLDRVSRSSCKVVTITR